ncbi:MAG: hypothetical protein HYS64_05220 [Rhodospirillales bacterium]|nr:hypothetical protein [Rhodospirillales bacterium]
MGLKKIVEQFHVQFVIFDNEDFFWHRSWLITISGQFAASKSGILDNRCAVVAQIDSYPTPAVPASGKPVEYPSAIGMMEYYPKRVKHVPGDDHRPNASARSGFLGAP